MPRGCVPKTTQIGLISEVWHLVCSSCLLQGGRNYTQYVLPSLLHQKWFGSGNLATFSVPFSGVPACTLLGAMHVEGLRRASGVLGCSPFPQSPVSPLFWRHADSSVKSNPRTGMIPDQAEPPRARCALWSDSQSETQSCFVLFPCGCSICRLELSPKGAIRYCKGRRDVLGTVQAILIMC